MCIFAFLHIGILFTAFCSLLSAENGPRGNFQFVYAHMYFVHCILFTAFCRPSVLGGQFAHARRRLAKKVQI